MVRGISRKQGSGDGGKYGGSLEIWDFDSCGERFPGKAAPAKEALPLFPSPPSCSPPPSRCAALGQLEPCWVPSVSEARCSLPSGPGHLPVSPTLVSGLPLPLPYFPASAAPRLAGVQCFQAAPLISNEGASLSRYYS